MSRQSGPGQAAAEPRWLMTKAVAATMAALVLTLMVPRLVPNDSAAALEEAKRLVGGDPEKGLLAMKRYGCAACHIIPGLKGTAGRVGPTLAGFSRRPVIGQRVPKTPENLVNWIIYPAQLDPQASMPGVGATEKDARDMATYLYALR